MEAKGELERARGGNTSVQSARHERNAKRQRLVDGGARGTEVEVDTQLTQKDVAEPKSQLTREAMTGQKERKRCSVLSTSILVRGLPAFANEEWVAILIGRTSVAQDDTTGERKIYMYRDKDGRPTGSCVVGMTSVEEALRVESELDRKRMEGDQGWFSLRVRVVPRRQTNPVALPCGWQRFTDDETGREYYYDTSTGKTQWDAPSLDNSTSLGITNDTDAHRTSSGRYAPFSGRAAAESFAVAAGVEPVHEYECFYCLGWHLSISVRAHVALFVRPTRRSLNTFVRSRACIPTFACPGPELPQHLREGVERGWTGFQPQPTREVPGGYISSSGTFLPHLPRGSKQDMLMVDRKVHCVYVRAFVRLRFRVRACDRVSFCVGACAFMVARAAGACFALSDEKLDRPTNEQPSTHPCMATQDLSIASGRASVAVEATAWACARASSARYIRAQIGQCIRKSTGCGSWASSGPRKSTTRWFPHPAMSPVSEEVLSGIPWTRSSARRMTTTKAPSVVWRKVCMFQWAGSRLGRFWQKRVRKGQGSRAKARSGNRR